MNQLLTILKDPRVKRLAAEAFIIRLAQAVEERNAAQIGNDSAFPESTLDAELLEALLVALEAE